MILRRPHLYDMHSSLPQQLSNFAFSRSRFITRVFLAIERFMIRRSKRRHRHLPIARGNREGDRAGRADGADRERARVRPKTKRPPADAAAVRRSLGLASRDAIVLVHGNVRSLPGPRPAVCGDGDRPAHAARRAAGARRRTAGPGREGARTGARGRHRGRHAFRRRAAGVRDSGVSARRRCAGLSAIARDQHAVEDLSVPALGQGDCRHPAADPHAGAGRRHGDPDRGSRRPTTRRAFLPALADPARAAAIGRTGARSCRDEVQLRRLPRQDAAGVRRADAGGDPAGASSRTSREAGALHRPLQLLGVCRSCDGADVRQAPVQRTDRRAGRKVAGARARKHGRTDQGSRRCSTSAPAPAAPR